jgi:hypothetical protein
MSDQNKYDLNDFNRVTYLGLADFRGGEQKFGIKALDRTRHTYVIGKTGYGKSTLLENMAIQDIQNGEGICFVDPHGSSAEKLLKYVPEHRLGDVVYFAPFDLDYPVGLNVLEEVPDDKRHLVASGLMAAFKKVFGEEKFSDRMENILNNIILALLENKDQALLGVNRMLSDKEYRKFIVSNVKDPAVRSFWNEEFAKAGDKYQQEAAPAIQNKIGQFISNPLIRNIVGQKHSAFDIRDLMDKRKILIANLSIGRMGEGNVKLLGSLLVTKIYLAAMSRANLSESELRNSPPFYFYVDEFQNFVNESFAQILSQARKYNLALTVAHQYIDQMTDEVKSAIFGNVGTMISFRTGPTDAEILEKEFAPQFTMDDIVNLSARQVYLRLCIDGAGSRPFSAKTLAPIPEPEHSFVPAVIATSRALYAKDRRSIEEDIKSWYRPVVEWFGHKKTPAEEAKDKVQKVLSDKKIEKVEERKWEDKKPPHNINNTNNKNTQDTPRPHIPNISQSADNKKNNALRDALNVALGVNLKKEESPVQVSKDADAKSNNDVTNSKHKKQIDDDDVKKILDL